MKHRLNKSLGGLIVIVFLIAILNIFPRQIKSAFYFVSNPIHERLWQAGERVSNFFKEISQAGSIKNNLDAVIQRNNELEKRIISLKSLEEENTFLKQALEINLNIKYELISGKITAKGLNDDYIIINRGQRNGVEKDMPVITENEVLVGKVAEVFDSYSKVFLLSNKNMSFDASIHRQDKEIPVIAEGRENLSIFLNYIPQQESVSEGDIVLTESLGGIFPAKLMIGKISKVNRTDIDAFQTAEIEPAFKLTGPQNLFIIKPL